MNKSCFNLFFCVSKVLRVLAVSGLLVGLIGVTPSRADIIIDGYTAQTNDRFTNHASFIAADFNLSGVGQASNGRWATAISRNVIISANHFRPTGTITFFETNDPNGNFVTRTVVSGIKVPNTDLYLGVLDSFLPGSIVHYSFATEPLSGPEGTLVSAGIYQGMNAYLFGRSPETQASNRDHAVGRNRISGYLENVDFAGNSDNDALLLIYDSPGDPNYVDFEAYLQSGDSGGPLFVDIDGEFRLMGTNAFINSGGINNPPVFSGINYTGNQTEFINDFIIQSIPEPSALVILMTTAVILIPRRRRSVSP